MLRAELQLAWKTQAGHRHQVEGLENEDAVFVTHQHPVFDAVLMVADGMGGHPLPREASEVAVRAAREFLFDPERLQTAGDVSRALSGALRTANRAVRALPHRRLIQAARNHPSLAVVADGALHLAHVGDGSVYLMRGGRARALAGGEERRAGNRPAQYLGQDAPLEPEQRQLPLTEGDRVLLCTDGLTRYFREAGPEALERVVGRSGVQVQAVASQLTAHSRPDEYDDDTTVALAEVTALLPVQQRAVAPKPVAPAPNREEPMLEATPGPHRGASPALGAVSALLGAVLLGAGFAAGRWSVPAALPGPGAEPVSGPPRQPVPPEVLQRLPAGNLVLLDSLGHTAYILPTRSKPPREPVDLQALKVGPDGRLQAAGRYRLDPARSELRDAQGSVYAAEIDPGRGAIRLLRGGTLVVTARAGGSRVWIDGREAGSAPLKVVLPAGPHRVRIESRTGSREYDEEIVPGGTVTIGLGQQ